MSGSVTRGTLKLLARDKDAALEVEKFLSEWLCGLSTGDASDAGFAVAAQVHASGRFRIGRLTFEGCQSDLRRTRKAIDLDRREEFAVFIPLAGVQHFQQFSQTCVSGPETITLVSFAEPFAMCGSGTYDAVFFILPQGFVDERSRRGETLCASALEITDGMRRLLVDGILSLQRSADNLSDSEFELASHRIAELVILTMNSSIGEFGQARSVRAVTLARAKKVIRARLTDSTLKLRDVAQDCEVSLRYLHKLFREDGTTIAEYLKLQRLQRARQLLEQGGRDTTVTAVGVRCGFSSSSQFSTAFRRAFDRTPREVLRRVI